MAIFLIFNIKDMKKKILENTPNKKKLVEAFKAQIKKQNIKFLNNVTFS